MRIGWIGLGAMGGRMAARLVAAGHEVIGFDVNPAAAVAGVIPATTVRAAGTDVDALFVMVATPAQAESVLLGPEGALAGLRAGTVVVVTATVGPACMTALSPEVATAGGVLVDAPVSGGTARAGTGELLMMVAAAEQALAPVRAALDELASRLVVVGSQVGDGQRVKLVNQLLCGVHIAAAAEALAFAGQLGLDPARCLEILSQGAATSFMFEDRGPRMVAGDFDDVRSAVDIFVKDMSLVTAAAAEHGFDASLADAAARRYGAAQQAGLGRKDDSSVITTYQP